MKPILAASLLLTLVPPVFALDAACEPILKASEAKLAQTAWHSTVESEGTKLESIKVDGQFFMNMDGKWEKSPMNLDEAEKIAIGMIKDGSFKVSECKDAGTDSIDGIAVNVLSYHSGEAGELGEGTVKLYIGKDDGLPYKSVMEEGKTTSATRYKDVSAPKL